MEKHKATVRYERQKVEDLLDDLAQLVHLDREHALVLGLVPERRDRLREGLVEQLDLRFQQVVDAQEHRHLQAALLHALKESGWLDLGRVSSGDLPSKKHLFAAPEMAQQSSKSELRRLVEEVPPPRMALVK
mgnify:CR=1 FL=1